MYSQSEEEKYILEYFGDYTGKFLDIGAGDGITFSNTFALLERGWSGILVEPEPRLFLELLTHLKDNPKVILFNVAVSRRGQICQFFRTNDFLSTVNRNFAKALEEKFSFATYFIRTISIEELLNFTGFVDFISIDTEGTSVELTLSLPEEFLKNLKLICVEYNSVVSDFNLVCDFLRKASFTKLLYKSAENVLLGK